MCVREGKYRECVRACVCKGRGGREIGVLMLCGVSVSALQCVCSHQIHTTPHHSISQPTPHT